MDKVDNVISNCCTYDNKGIKYQVVFFFYEEAERVAHHLMENDPNVWAVKIQKMGGEK